MADARRQRRFLTGETLFWVVLGFLAIYVFVHEFLPAARERKRTEDLVRNLRREEQRLEEARDRLLLKRQALEQGEPTTVEQALRDLGYVPTDHVRVIDSDAPPPPAAAPPR